MEQIDRIKIKPWNNYRIPIFSLIGMVLFAFNAYSQKDTMPDNKEDIEHIENGNKKSGWGFGGVPAVAFNSDIGFKVGAVLNMYNYGDIYPLYKHSIFLEYSITTRRSGIKQIIYDSKYLIPNVRVTSELSHLTERALDFYGFNGYKAIYNSNFEDDSKDNPFYRSRLYYRLDRSLIRTRADFQGKLKWEGLRWIFGLAHYSIQMDTVNIDKLNKGKEKEDKLPYYGGGLYGQYIDWGIISQEERHGGGHTLIKLGVVYDSRDNEPKPNKGIWTDILWIYSPGIWEGNDFSFSKLAFTHRQYIPLIGPRLSFAYRLGYQAKLGGNIPAYMLPFIFYYGNSRSRDGLGGGYTVRGILRNRIVGNDYLYGNFELRWKCINTVLLKQNLYFALSLFSDFGMVTDYYDIDYSKIQDPLLMPGPSVHERPHIGVGAGLHVAINENFILAFDFGVPLDHNDGKPSLYIGLNWLF